jgi:hypothetical protein
MLGTGPPKVPRQSNVSDSDFRIHKIGHGAVPRLDPGPASSEGSKAQGRLSIVGTLTNKLEVGKRHTLVRYIQRRHRGKGTKQPVMSTNIIYFSLPHITLPPILTST